MEKKYIYFDQAVTHESECSLIHKPCYVLILFQILITIHSTQHQFRLAVGEINSIKMC